MSPVDKRGKLAEGAFAYQVSKDGRLMIAWQGKTVTTLKGPAAQKLLEKLQRLDDHGVQLTLAKATGHFKHGNERRSPPAK